MGACLADCKQARASLPDAPQGVHATSVEQVEEEQSYAVPQTAEETTLLNCFQGHQIAAVHQLLAQLDLNLADHIAFGDRGHQLRVHGHAGRPDVGMFLIFLSHFHFPYKFP